ncbi:MAG: response regulator transcription factor [Geobacter sp.]|jgi:DNA-binding NarL/FixJ family response regulator|nr:response regulator transcription factor [Geobacter sp.]
MHTILIIEDDDAIRSSMELVLRMEGYTCLTAPDGQSGLALINNRHPDLVLCDIMMEKLDGHAVLQAMKQDHATAAIPFIFVTALGDRAELRRGMSAGADDYLTKPFTDEELVAAVVGRLHRAEMLRTAGSHAQFQSELEILRQEVTAREREVLALVGRGMTSKDIACRLEISFKTAQAHRANLMKKLQALNAAHLSRWAVIAELL